jgi:hypothetical protein
MKTKIKLILACILFVSINTYGQFKTEKNYDYVTGPINGFAEGVLGDFLNGKRCLLDSTGKELTQCIYDRIGFGTLDFSNGIAVVIKNGKYGFLSRNGVEIIECKYECALNFSEGLAAVKENGKWGFINQKGAYAIANIYDSATAGFFHEGDVLFSNGYARVILNGKAIFIDKKGNKIKDCPYERVEPFYSNLAAVKLNGNWGFIDELLNLVIPCIYSSNSMFNDNGGSWNYPFAPRFSDNLCKVTLISDSLYNVIDILGRTQLPWCRLIIEIPPANQLSVVLRVDRKLAIIDNKLNILSDAFYDEVFTDYGFDLQEGSRNNMILPADVTNIRVRKQNYYGFIINKGKSFIPCIYDEANDFINGKAKVKMNEATFYIDEKGNKIK